MALIEAVIAAQERRHEVSDLIWNSTDTEDAAQSLREVLQIPPGTDPRVVLDMQLSKLTRNAREGLHRRAQELRELLARE